MSANFSVPVPGIGDFMFRRRSFRDGIKIQAEYEALTGGLDEPSDNLHLIASAWSAAVVQGRGPAARARARTRAAYSLARCPTVSAKTSTAAARCASASACADAMSACVRA